MKKKFSRDRLKAAKELKGGVQTEGPPFDAEIDDDEDTAGLWPESEAAAAADSGRLQIVVKPEEAGRRLDALLASRRPEFTRSQLARLAKEGLVDIDGRPVKPSVAVAAGQCITCPIPGPPLTSMRPEPDVTLDVIYEDEDILVVNKPWALAVHPAPGYHGPTLAGGLLARDARLAELGEAHRPGLVHRLDKDTSGVLVTAKTEAALRNLSAAFSARETRKCYLAFVKGRPKANSGLIDSPIGRHPTQRHKMAVVTSGRPAKTIWRLIKYFPRPGLSLVMLTLITGRTHQARVHLQALGAPVLADPVYSRGEADLIKITPEIKPFLTRQLLHARRLTIDHPTSHRPMTFRAPWPNDFIGLFKLLSSINP